MMTEREWIEGVDPNGIYISAALERDLRVNVGVGRWWETHTFGESMLEITTKAMGGMLDNTDMALAWGSEVVGGLEELEDKRELNKVRVEEDRRSLDFDHSMNG